MPGREDFARSTARFRDQVVLLQEVVPASERVLRNLLATSYEFLMPDEAGLPCARSLLGGHTWVPCQGPCMDQTSVQELCHVHELIPVQRFDILTLLSVYCHN